MRLLFFTLMEAQILIVELKRNKGGARGRVIP